MSSVGNASSKQSKSMGLYEFLKLDGNGVDIYEKRVGNERFLYFASYGKWVVSTPLVAK